jgi:MFS family permease
MAINGAYPEIVETLIPARLDRLPWSGFHSLLVIGLGITWILDGLEVTLVGAISAVLQRPDVLGLSAAQIGLLGSVYLAGAVLGSLFFGYLTDSYGRRRFFFVSLSVYLAGVALSSLAWNGASLAVFRFVTGAGIGGEYSAVNSAIDELIPARFRGRVDLAVNGSFWLGAAAGSASTIVILNPQILPYRIGWRCGFAVGALLGLGILYMRRFIPESPRWLVTHGQQAEAERVTARIEATVAAEKGLPLRDDEGGPPLKIHVRRHFHLGAVIGPLLAKYRSRAVLGLALMAAQAFMYNAIFFTYALVLNRFYGVSASHTGIYLLPFALTNFAGPVVLGPYFDIVGRRHMIAGTYLLSALMLGISGALFAGGMLSSFSQTALWAAMFFVASPAASSAYLTVSEIFPLEMRSFAIAIFYSAGTGIGGVVAPWFFGKLIDSGLRDALFGGYLVAAGLMAGAAAIELLLGVDAERKQLEQIAAPLSAFE